MTLSPDVPVALSTTDLGSSICLDITFKAAPKSGWITALCMLYFKKIDTVRVEDRSSRISLAIRGPEVKASKLAVYHTKLHEYTVWLDEKQLGALIGFFLTYLRDGRAEVNHLDLEAAPRSKAGKRIDLIFKVPDSRPHLSQEELLRQLDLD